MGEDILTQYFEEEAQGYNILFRCLLCLKDYTKLGKHKFKAKYQKRKGGSFYRGLNGISKSGQGNHLEKYHPEIKLKEQEECKHEFVCKYCKKQL